MRRKEEENGVGGTETRYGTEKGRFATCVVRTLVLVEGTNHLHTVMGPSSHKSTYNTGTEFSLVDYFSSFAHLLSTLQRPSVEVIHITRTLLGAWVTQPITAQTITLLADDVGGTLLVGVGAGAEGTGVLGTAVRHGAFGGGRAARVVVAENVAVGAGERGGAVLRVVGVMEEVGAEQIGAGDGAAIGMLVEKELADVGNAVIADFDVG